MIVIPPRKNGAPSKTRRGATPHPDWFQEWLDNKTDHVLLHCGHKTDSRDRGIGLRYRDKRLHVYCVECDDFSAIDRHISAGEFIGLTPYVSPDVCPF